MNRLIVWAAALVVSIGVLGTIFTTSRGDMRINLSPQIPVIFQWEEGGKPRCEMWYPQGKYYWSCAGGIPEETTKNFKRYGGSPPAKLGFPPPPPLKVA